MIFISANILLVEDSLTQVKMIQTTLEAINHKVIVSHDGSDVFNILAGNKIDIILLDIILPAANGFELLKILLEDEVANEIPVIMLTGLTGGINVKKALDMGALDYIKKPVEPIELIARINSALRLKSKQDLLKEHAQRDNLTGLYNRAYFDRELPKLLENISSYKKGIAIAMIDCDFFKKINDTYGHMPGDIVLSTIAATIHKSVRSKDFVCRYGGEEFCIMLPDTSLEEGLAFCEAARENVEKTKFIFNEQEVSITISIGLTHSSVSRTADFHTLVHESDRALYLAKGNGRNRVETLKKDIY